VCGSSVSEQCQCSKVGVGEGSSDTGCMMEEFRMAKDQLSAKSLRLLALRMTVERIMSGSCLRGLRMRSTISGFA
jgi:hypothetical protein